MLQVSAGQGTEGAAQERPEPGSKRRAAPAASSSSAPRPAAAGSTSLRAIGCRGEGTGGLRGGEGVGGGSGLPQRYASLGPSGWASGRRAGGCPTAAASPSAGVLGLKWDRTDSALPPFFPLFVLVGIPRLSVTTFPSLLLPRNDPCLVFFAIGERITEANRDVPLLVA